MIKKLDYTTENINRFHQILYKLNMSNVEKQIVTSSSAASKLSFTEKRWDLGWGVENTKPFLGDSVDNLPFADVSFEKNQIQLTWPGYTVSSSDSTPGLVFFRAVYPMDNPIQSIRVCTIGS